MSLINDALKRASETKQQTGDPPPPVALNPVDYAVRPNPAFRFLVALLLATALAFAVWFLGKWRQHSALSAKPEAITNRGPSTVTSPVPSSPTENPAKPRIKVSTDFVVRTNASPGPASAPGESVSAVPDSTPESPSTIAGTAVASTNAVETPAPPPEEATNSFPKLKLQSIVYRLSNPAVVLNGEMLHVGDTIKEARIVKIERYAVTLEWRGQTNVLSLPRL